MSMATFITLNVNGTEYKVDVDPDNYTAAELNGIERNTGMTWQEWLLKLGDRKVSSLAWTALAWIAVRRSGAYTPWDEFEDSVKIMELIASASPEDVAEKAPRAVRRASKTN
jgi:hypothetical protein